MAKHKNYEPSARDITRATRRIRKGWTTGKHHARRGEALDPNAHAIGWLPPVVHVSDILGHTAFLDEHEA